MSPESNGARVAGDLGSWRWVYLRFDLSPSGKSGGKEKVTKSEQFAALPGVGAVGQVAATVPVTKRNEGRT